MAQTIHLKTNERSTQLFRLKKKIDPIIPVAGLGLSIIGLVMILSASQTYSIQQFGNPYHFLLKQFLAWLVGFVCLIYFMRVKLEKLYAMRIQFVVITIIILALVFVPVIGPRIASVHRWINLGFTNIQSAEVAKLLLIIAFSAFLASRAEVINDPIKVLLPFLLALAAAVGLIMLEPDMGTAVLIVIVVMTLLFTTKISLIQFIAVSIVGLVVFVTFAYAAPYRVERVVAYLQRGNGSADYSYHTQQALIAIGSGGMWGMGFGQGISKYSYLPQAHTDSIFAVIGEELGFVRSIFIIAIYLVIAWRGFLVARNANSHFVRLIATGVSTLIVAQMLINIGGMIGFIPLTGIPLPLISYGGSSLVVSMAAIGLLTNTSREVE